MRLDSDSTTFLLDVRTPEEYRDEVFINKSINIDVNTLYSNIHKLPEEETTRIVVYCKSGARSKIAASKLVVIGYSNVSNMINGFKEWVRKGFPFVIVNGTESIITTSEVDFELVCVFIPTTIMVIVRFYEKKKAS